MCTEKTIYVLLENMVIGVRCIAQGYGGLHAYVETMFYEEGWT